jgi:hypothetical protein
VASGGSTARRQWRYCEGCVSSANPAERLGPICFHCTAGCGCWVLGTSPKWRNSSPSITTIRCGGEWQYEAALGDLDRAIDLAQRQDRASIAAYARDDPMRILLTGFGPFGRLEINPSQEIVQAIFGAAGDRIRRLIREIRPEACVCLGVYEGGAAIRLERVAMNRDAPGLPDVAGQLRSLCGFMHVPPISGPGRTPQPYSGIALRDVARSRRILPRRFTGIDDRKLIVAVHAIWSPFPARPSRLQPRSACGVAQCHLV